MRLLAESIQGRYDETLISLCLLGAFALLSLFVIFVLPKWERSRDKRNTKK